MKGWSRSVQARVMNIAGTLLMAVSQWLQIILITRLLGLYEVGLFSYFLALTGPLVLFSRFTLARLLPTQRRLKYDYSIFSQFRSITNHGFIIISIILMVFIDFNLYESICFMVFIIFKYYENKEEFIYTENISESRILFLGQSKIIKSIVTIVLFASSILLFESLLAAILSLFAGQYLVYRFFDRKHGISVKNGLSQITPTQFKNIFLLGFGLCFVEILSSLSTNIPRYILEEYHSVEVLGIFATIMYFTVITNNVVMAINEGVIANLAREAVVSIRKFYRSFFKLCGMFLVLILIGEVILALYGNDIVVLVYGPEFMGFEREMLLLGILLIFVVYSKILEMALSVLNLYKELVFIQMLTFIITVVLSLVVIIPYGLTGAFVVSIITLALMVAGQVGVMLHHWHKKGQFE